MKKPEYRETWPADVKALYEHDMQELWDASRMLHVFHAYQDELQRYIRLVGTDPRRILDVGVAQATLAMLLAERGHRVTAMDIRPAFLEYARSRYERGEIDFVAGNILETDLQDRFDLVFANQLLEHLVEPERLLRKIHHLLVPGGRTVLTTPAAEYVMNRLPTFTELGDPAQYTDRQFFADGDGHFFAYTARELKSLLADTGFHRIRIHRYASPWITGHLKVRFLHGKCPLPLLRRLDRLVLAVPGLSRCLGYQLMVVAEKGAEH